MCSEKCQDSKDHIPECNLTHKKITNLGVKKILPLYEVVAVFRCLHYKFTDQDKYECVQRLLSYPSHRYRKKEAVFNNYLSEYYTCHDTSLANLDGNFRRIFIPTQILMGWNSVNGVGIAVRRDHLS